ncbi:MAG: hypothetical protein HC824_06080 [Synechococcales cyanobacterium RM1_1_8]|nr:hypothetical protein [Synechococcales cyanobacterium RM1_1_8]
MPSHRSGTAAPGTAAPPPPPPVQTPITSAAEPEPPPQARLAPIGHGVSPTLNQVWHEDEVVRSAKQLAQFFNGEVVIEDGLLQDAGSEGEAIPPAPPPTSGMDDDDDVPF